VLPPLDPRLTGHPDQAWKDLLKHRDIAAARPKCAATAGKCPPSRFVFGAVSSMYPVSTAAISGMVQRLSVCPSDCFDLANNKVTRLSSGSFIVIGRLRGCALLMILDVRLASTRFILLPSITLAILIFSEMPLYSQSNLHTDRSGYTTGTIGSNSVNIYRDRDGNMTGSIGSKRITTYSDGYGGTTGTIGNNRINTNSDGYGNTTGTIGKDRVNVYTDRFGNTTGTIGRRSVICYSDRFGNTTCN